MGIAKLHAKITCIHANIMKNSDLNFVFMQNFVQKKYLFRMNVQFHAKSGFVLIQKMMKNFVQKK